MDFIEFVAVIRRHRVLVGVCAAFAVIAAVLASYNLQGTRLVSRSQPTYETTAVVAIKPGDEIALLSPAPVDEPVPTTTQSSGANPTDTSVTTTIATPTTTIAPALDDVIDSRKFYYAALSIQSAIVAPGFVQMVHEVSPTTDGSIAAVVPLDTNTIRIVVNASSPAHATDTVNAALAQLRPLVISYASSGAFRFTLDVEVLSGPSTPSAVSSIKGPLTSALVFAVIIVLSWLSLRALDMLQRQKRDPERPDHAQDLPSETIHLYIDDGAWIDSSPPPTGRARGEDRRVEPEAAGPRAAMDRVEPRAAGPRRRLDRVQPRVVRPAGSADRVEPPLSRTARSGDQSRPTVESHVEGPRPESNGVRPPLDAPPIDSSRLDPHVEEDPPKASPR